MKNKGLQRHIKTLVYLAPDKTPLWRKTRAALLRLQRGLTGERKLAGRQYMEENDLLSAYLLYYWPVSYQQVSCIIKNMTQKPFPREKISILDIGSGPGPASAALCDHLISSQHISGKDICVCHADYSEKALSLASRIFSRDFPEIQAEAIPCKIGKELMNKLSVPKARSFSIAIFCHSLNELWQDAKDSIQRRAGFIKELMDSHMEEHSLLILCEPAQTKSSRELIAVRDSLLAQTKNIRLLSPCQGQSPCPALLQGEGTTCHSEGDWEEVEPASSLAQSCGLDRSSVKMSYFVFQKTSTADTEDKKEESGSFTARVVSDAMLNKAGRIRFVLCDGARRFSLSAKKEDSIAQEKGFWNLRRGQLIRVTGAEPRSQAEKISFAVTESTEIRLLSN